MTSALHLYALLDRAAPRMPAGAFGERLLQVETGRLVGVAGLLEAPTEDDAAAVLAHARVVSELAEDAAAVLPARFATRFADAEALQVALAGDEERLARALEHVRGCVELSVVAAFSDDAGDEQPAQTGREYLERRVRATRRLDELVAAVHEPLAAIALDARLHRALAPLRFSATYLVPRDAVAAFTARADAAAAAADVPLVRGGPWPPYSFAEEAAA